MDNTDSHCLLQAWTPLTIKTNHYTSVSTYWIVKIQEMEITPWIKFLTRINPVSIRSVDTCTSMDKNYSVKCGFFRRKQEFTAWISQKIKTYIYICPLIEFNTFQNLTSSGSMFQSREMYYKYHKKTTTPELKNTWISIKTKYTDKIQINMHTCIFSAVLKLLD